LIPGWLLQATYSKVLEEFLAEVVKTLTVQHSAAYEIGALQDGWKIDEFQ
jgi:hypothetical protein